MPGRHAVCRGAQASPFASPGFLVTVRNMELTLCFLSLPLGVAGEVRPWVFRPSYCGSAVLTGALLLRQCGGYGRLKAWAC